MNVRCLLKVCGSQLTRTDSCRLSWDIQRSLTNLVSTVGGASSLSSSAPAARTSATSDDSDVDGTPLRVDSTSVQSSKSKGANLGVGPGFVPSKWETIDPEEVQAQAVTSKWDIFDQQEEDKKKQKAVTEPDDDDDDDDVDGKLSALTLTIRQLLILYL